jgi:hypothetical protein
VSSRIPSGSRSWRSPPSTLLWVPPMEVDRFKHRHYLSRPSPHSHWSATGPRNQQITFRAKPHQHTQRKLARLAACAAPVRPVDRAGHAYGYRSRTTSVPESLNDFSRLSNKNTPKTQPTQKENPTQNLAKQLQTDQELTSSTKTQRHTSQAVHPRQIPQVAYTGQTGHRHRSDRSSLGSSG